MVVILLFITNCDIHDHDHEIKHRIANDRRNGLNIDNSCANKENHSHQHEKSHDRNIPTNHNFCNGSNSSTYKHDNGDLDTNT